MDNVTYKNAPLVELIVQLQWQVNALGITGAPQLVSSNSVGFDLWFSNLTNNLKNHGYSQLERVIPGDMPAIAHQVIYRYRKQESHFPIIQFGHGVFTINAGPPTYQSWNEFRPIVKTALDSLVNSIPDNTSITNFTHASMRYIDVFKEDLRDGASNYDFITNKLGISLEFPFDIQNYTSDLNSVNPTYAFNMPLKDKPERKLVFQIASGHIGKASQAFETIMDLSYLVDSSINKDTEEVLSILDDSHHTLHEWFTRITENIKHKMMPQEKTED